MRLTFMLMWVWSVLAVARAANELETALDDLEDVLHTNNDHQTDVAKALKQRLPHIRAQVRQLARTASNFSFFIGLMTDGQKVAFAKSQLDRFEAEVNLFKSLPVVIQERMLSHLLARNEEAKEIFIENMDVIVELGFEFDAHRVLHLAAMRRVPRQALY